MALWAGLCGGCGLDVGFENLKSTQNFSPETGIYISELQAENSSCLHDFQGEFSDWIELSNNSSEAINLGTYALSDDIGEPEKWQFPDIELDPGAYLLVFASGKDYRDAAYQLHANFKLSGEGECLYVFRSKRLVDMVKGFEVGTDKSLNRAQDWGLSLSGAPSPGAARALT